MQLLINTQRRVIIGLIMFNLMVNMIFFAVFGYDSAFILGEIFGSLITILNFRLMALSIVKSLNMIELRARKYMVTRSLIRLFIAGIVLLVSISSEHISAIGTFIGLISLKPVAIVVGLSIKEKIGG